MKIGIKIVTQSLVIIIAYYLFAAWQPFPLTAQTSLGGHPLSWSLSSENEAPPVEEIPLAALEASKKATFPDSLSPLMQIAYPVQTSWSLSSSGDWVSLPEGGRLWRLTIRGQGAKHISVSFNKLFLPKGSLLYLYNKNRTKCIGGFSFHNNQKHGELSTEPLPGEQITIEYFEPEAAKGQGQFNICRVSYGYVPLEQIFAKTLYDCHVNINCSPEGDNWQRAKKSITMMIINGAFVCTGTLINNSAEDFTPYVLTSRHCLTPANYDAVTQPIASDIVFYWNYAAPDCSGVVSSPSSTTSGAFVVANAAETGVAGSDFALLRLNENPADWFDVYFAGYSSENIAPSSGVSLHHPGGQALKIATFASPAISYISDRYWRVYFMQTPNGFSVTEGGSSGAPLFDLNERVTGQLYGGSNINCADPATDWSIYGKIAYSWNNNGSTDPRRRLSDWLDPIGNGQNLSQEGLSAAERPTQCAKPFFSEYVEGYALQRCLEIYNPTEDTINLAESAYSLAFYFEGNTLAGSVIPLTGAIPPKSVYVVCDNDAGIYLLALANQTALPIFFNGDDAVVLFKGSRVIDAIGQIGSDPGIEWGTGNTSTQNNTIRRKTEISKGDNNPYDHFDPALEWEGYPIATFNGMGIHDCSCNNYTCVPGLLNNYSCDAADVPLVLPPGAVLWGTGASDTLFSPAQAGFGIHNFIYIQGLDTCRFEIMIADTLAPKIACKDLSINQIPAEGYLLDPSELVEIEQSSDNCGTWEVIELSPASILPGQTGQVISVQITAQDASGNQSQCSSKVVVIAPVTQHGTFEPGQVQTWPNPSSGLVNIQTNKAIFKIEIRDMNGRLQWSARQQEVGIIPIDLSNQPDGLYYSSITFLDGSIQLGKIVLAR